MSAPAVVIGAGPAGLAAAYELAKRGEPVVVLEKDDLVGGLSRTVEYKGFRCDIGGHRFFTKNSYVDGLWREVLGPEFLRRPRLSRIYYRGRFYDYPLRVWNALRNLGPLTSVAVVASFLAAKVRPRRGEDNFAEWVSRRFGRRLFNIFFRTYTEKVWGMRCEELSADWAVQRIRNLSLGRAILDALHLGRRGSVASLIDEFDYPLHGPGQMYDRMAELAGGRGADIRLRWRARGVEHSVGKVTAVEADTPAGRQRVEVGRACFSSMPLDELVRAMNPPAPPEVLAAAGKLHYRSLLTVNLLLSADPGIPDNWLYIHDPLVKAGRLQLYKNWSPGMVPSPDQAVVGLEYFCTEDDGFWRQSDGQLVALATEDLRTMKLIDPALVFDSFVVRYPKAYPVYDEGYSDRLRVIRDWLGRIGNLYPIGRYGQFRYNNMDHSILTAHFSVRAMAGEAVDPWSVNVEQAHLEEKR